MILLDSEVMIDLPPEITCGEKLLDGRGPSSTDEQHICDSQWVIGGMLDSWRQQ